MRLRNALTCIPQKFASLLYISSMILIIIIKIFLIVVICFFYGMIPKKMGNND